MAIGMMATRRFCGKQYVGRSIQHALSRTNEAVLVSIRSSFNCSKRSLASTSKPPLRRQPTKAAVANVQYPQLKTFFIGSFAGALGSLAGMGGGFVMIPLMTMPFLLNLSQHQAHGTSLFAVAATGIAGALGYQGHVNLEIAAAISVTGMIMARAGAKMTSILSERALKRALGVFMLLVAPTVPAKAYFFQGLEEKSPASLLPHDDASFENEPMEKGLVRRLVPPALIGLCSGFLAGLFGVGGGAVVVPALTLCTDMSHYESLGTSLCAMALPAIVGTRTHFRQGNVHLRIAPTLAIGAFGGAYLGGKFGTETDENTLRWGFSSLMMILGIRTLMKA